MGDFLLKNRMEVEEDVHSAAQDVSYRDPIETLPESSPTICHASDTPMNDWDG